MLKKILFLLAFSVLLLCPLLSGAEQVAVDSRIVALHTTFECGCEVTKDGVMISQNGLVTKSNALYCSTHGKKYSHITFYFGYVGNGNAVYQYDGDDFKCHAYETFEGGYNQENDIGYVKFFEPIGDETGWYAIKAPSDNDLNGANLFYRINRPSGTEERTVPSFTILDKKFLYMPYTESIASGLPVILPDQYAGDGYVVGIINSYVNSGTEQHCNIRRITSRVYNDMLSDGLFYEADEFSAPKVKTMNVESAAASAPASVQAAAPETAAAMPAGQEVLAQEDTWICPECGQTGNFGNFCFNCGVARPVEEDSDEWTCPGCGQEGNYGNFCPICGTPKPEASQPAAEP